MTRIQKAYHEYQRGANEGGEGYNPFTETLRQEAMAADIAGEAHAEQAHAARLAAENAEWTADVTAARRAEHNAWVTSYGRLTPGALLDRAKAVGYGVDVLKRQVARHNS